MFKFISEIELEKCLQSSSQPDRVFVDYRLRDLSKTLERSDYYYLATVLRPCFGLQR